MKGDALASLSEDGASLGAPLAAAPRGIAPIVLTALAALLVGAGLGVALGYWLGTRSQREESE
jgi:hypothetical protein